MCALVSCANCIASFKEYDKIYGAECGHIFHKDCYDRLMFRSKFCPICHTYFTTPLHIKLNFQNGIVYETVVNGLKAKAKYCSDVNQKLQAQLDEKEKKIEAAEKSLKISEQSRSGLENDIQKLSLEKQQVAKRSEELAAKLEEINIEIMEKQNAIEHLSAKYNELIVKNSNLIKNLNDSEILNEKLQAKLDEKEKKIEAIEKSLEISEQWRLELDDFILTLSQEYDQKQKEIMENQNAVKNLSAKLNELIDENSRLTKNLNESEILNETLQAKLDEKEKKIEAAEKSLKRSERSRLEFTQDLLKYFIYSKKQTTPKNWQQK